MTTPHTLEQLYLQHDGKVSDKWSIYLAEYEHLFAPYRTLELSVLEIGVQNGGSLEIWAKYFSSAKSIVGCDINEDCRLLVFDDPKISLIVGDANTDDIEQKILSKASGFDLVIDDGSHKSGDIVRSFARYFEHLSDDGLYIAEDLHCSYWQDFSGGLFDPFSSIAFFKRLTDIINQEHWGAGKARVDLLDSFYRHYEIRLQEDLLSHIHSIEFVNSICVVRKRSSERNLLGNRVVVGKIAPVWDGALLLNGSTNPERDQRENPWAIRPVPIEEDLIARMEEVVVLQQNLNLRNADIERISQASTQRELAHVSELSHVRQEIDAQSMELVNSEKTASEQLQRLFQDHESQKYALARAHAEREKHLQKELSQARLDLDIKSQQFLEYERVSLDSMRKLAQVQNQQILDQVNEHSKREQNYVSQLNQAQSENKSQLLASADREQNFLDRLQQLHAVQEQQKEDLKNKYAKKEKAYAAELALTKQRLEEQLHKLAVRERRIAQQLQATQQTCEQRKKEHSQKIVELDATFAHKIGAVRHAHESLVDRQKLEQHKLAQSYLARIDQANGELQLHLHRLDEREAAFSKQLDELNSEYAHQMELRTLERKNSEQSLHANLLAKQKEFAVVKQHSGELAAEYASALNELLWEIDAMRGNFSWRWTAFLRRAAALVGYQNEGASANVAHARINALIEKFRLHIPADKAFSKIDDSPLSSNTDTEAFNMILRDTVNAADTIEELFSYQDERFIRCAYRTILGRTPDADGLNYYLRRIRSGISKMEIVAQLGFSKEGKSKQVSLAGFNKAIKQYQRERKSFSVTLGGWLGVEHNSLARNVRIVENKMYLLDEYSKGKFFALDEAIRRLEKISQIQERAQIQLQRGLQPFRKSVEHAAIGAVLDKHPLLSALTSEPMEVDARVEEVLPPVVVKPPLAEPADSGVTASVVILTKNAGSIFKEVLASALNQDVPWTYEVLVIDSGSSDGTLDFIRQYPQVRLVEIKPTEFGHGKTRNFGVSISKGKYVAMLTHDAMPLNSSWLRNLVAPFEKDMQVAGVFGRHKAYADHSPYIKRDMEMHFDGFLQWPAIMGIEDPARYVREEGYRQVLHFFSDNNACIRKSVWEKIPYPNVNFAEDQLWAKAIMEAGYKRAYANDAVVYHSHDYSIKDTFRRSFDESRALKSLLGYDLCPTAKHGIAQIYACAKSDLKFLSGYAGLSTKAALAFKTPFLHVAKQTGWYVGRYQGRLRGPLFWLFSLDGAKKRKSNLSMFNKIKSVFATKDAVGEQQPDFVPPPIELKSLNSAGNKTDVIGFYDFVITKDAGTLPVSSSAVKGLTINWLIPDFGIGSGGHLNIFRFISMLEKRGYKNTICIVGSNKQESPLRAKEAICKHFFELEAHVVFGVETLAPAYYSFATSWITAYALRGFGQTVHKLYFVQDFEPAFYSRGSEYDFAEETYKFGFHGICAGSWLSKKLSADYGMKCQSVGFSFDRDLYQQTLRREPNKLRVFCYCRPPTIRRGWESAMLALSLVGQKLPDVEFIFAGWDMSNYYFPYPHLNAGVCSLKELPDLYSQCDVALVFSFTNLSLLPLELMACGCIVVSNRAPNTEWLLNDENSVIPASSSPRSVADAMIDILENPVKRRDLARAAKDFASLTVWEVEGEKMASILTELV